jgi:hypothetical protein
LTIRSQSGCDWGRGGTMGRNRHVGFVSIGLLGLHVIERYRRAAGWSVVDLSRVGEMQVQRLLAARVRYSS